MALKNINGIVAVITGGASGIGLATACTLSSQGAHVVLADINEQALQQAADHVKKSGATGQVVTKKTDVTSEEQVQALMQITLDTCSGRIDLVMTSAGIGRGNLIDMFTAQEMQTLMNINFMGTYHCVRAALPTMRQQQSGHFVFLSSAAGKLGVPLLTAYCASKWAVRGFSSALRAELYGTGIDVTTVYPSWVDTPMTRQEGMELLNIEAKLTAEQVAEEIVQAVLSGRHDLTLAPDEGTEKLLRIMQEDPDKAERLMGETFQERLQEFSRGTA
ncbi:MAG: SDR family oxidoreductase [Ktedonobacteraceae bacterium]|nr:SDR family oxidoreductase [Ktedonobacteraceae bacterium]